jgi:aminoglycoside phosphotransferase (APT) family kinase protein
VAPAPWASEHALDPHTVRALVEAQFEDLGSVDAVYLDEGWDSTVYEVNGRWIFRFPKRAEAEATHDVEAALLPRLADRVPIAIPRPVRRGEPGLGYPYRFFAYEKLPGTPAILLPLDSVDVDATGSQLGAFLTAVHAFPTTEATALGVRTYSMEGRFERWRGDLVERFDTMRPTLSPSLVERSLAFLRGPLPSASGAPGCLVHYDLCDGHVLVDVAARRACGVIDWGDTCIGDPAMDLAGLWQWLGEPFVVAALRAYRGTAVDDAVLARARAAAAVIALSTLWYGVAGGRPEFVGSGLRSLEHTLPA